MHLLDFSAAGLCEGPDLLKRESDDLVSTLERPGRRHLGTTVVCSLDQALCWGQFESV